MKGKQLIITLFFVISIFSSCVNNPKEPDFIDNSIEEFAQYFKPKNVFMIVYCTDEEEVLKIHVESRERKVDFIGGFYTYCLSKNNCIDILLNGNCIDLTKLTNKRLEQNFDFPEKDTIYSHTGDNTLTEFKFISILYDVQSNKILRTLTYDEEWLFYWLNC